MSVIVHKCCMMNTPHSLVLIIVRIIQSRSISLYI